MSKTNIGSGQAMDLDGFLGHSTRGVSATFLDNWTARNPPQVRVVLHTRASIMGVWMHPWPRIVTRDRDGKEVREVWSGNFNSWESEETLKNQFRRDETGRRVMPPTVCPMSLMLEQVHQLYQQQQISWSDPLFKFVGDDATKAKVLHAGSMIGIMKKLWEDLGSEEKQRAVKAGFPPPSEAWKEAMQAKCQYIFTLADYDDIKAGIQVAKQTALVGDKMRTAINDRITSEGPEKGNPLRTPYVFQWVYNAAAKNFGEKYHVVAIGGTCPITPAVRELVVEKDPPDISRMIAKGDIVELRASMEDHYCGPKGLLDWDYIFGTAEKIQGIEQDAGDPDDDRDVEQIATEISTKETTKEAAKAASAESAKAAPATEAPAEPEAATTAPAAARKRRTAKAAEDPKYVIADRQVENGEERTFAADGMELLACEECQTIMRANEDTCRQCGAKYEIEPEQAAPATAAPAKPAATAQATAKAAGKDRLAF